jgi:hypothetical protein
MGDSRSRMMPVAFRDDAAATLAGVEIAEERLLTYAVRAAPTGVAI